MYKNNLKMSNQNIISSSNYGIIHIMVQNILKKILLQVKQI